MNNSVRESEAHNLIKKGVDNKNLLRELSALRAKYNNTDLVDEIQKLYLEKYNKLVRRARKFADLIKKKYGSSQYPFHVLLDKAKKFKQKHNLHDDEFVLFRRFYEEELVGLKSMEVIPYSTNMTKVLGTISVTTTPSNMKLSGEDYKHMQEIVNMASTNKSLHSQVYLQSLQHTAVKPALPFNEKGNYTNNDAVHPVLVALFAAKLEKIDKHFLLPSLARVVKNRYNNEPLESREDADLFYNITRDPNDVVCDGSSSVLDLLNRCKIQQQLWNCVLSLREGKMWNRSFNEFMNSIDNCKYNKYDNPDLIYGRNDIVVLRRILAAFSYRPTIVTSNTAVTQNIFNPYMHTSRPVVMSIPVINLDAENASKNEVEYDVAAAAAAGAAAGVIAVAAAKVVADAAKTAIGVATAVAANNATTEDAALTAAANAITALNAANIAVDAARAANIATEEQKTDSVAIADLANIILKATSSSGKANAAAVAGANLVAVIAAINGLAGVGVGAGARQPDTVATIVMLTNIIAELTKIHTILEIISSKPPKSGILLPVKFESKNPLNNTTNITHSVNSTDDYIIYCINRNSQSVEYNKLYEPKFELEYPSSLVESKKVIITTPVFIDYDNKMLDKDAKLVTLENTSTLQLVSSVHANQVKIPNSKPEKYITKLSHAVLYEAGVQKQIYDSEKKDPLDATNKLSTSDKKNTSNLTTGVIYIFKKV
jgi:hypothetical protein